MTGVQTCALPISSLGVRVLRVSTVSELRSALREAKEAPADGGPVLIHIETDPLAGAPDSDAWWDVPVSETAALDTTRAARAEYERQKKAQRPLIGPASDGSDA